MPSTVVRPYQTVLQMIAVVWFIVAVLALAANSITRQPAGTESRSTETQQLSSGDLLVIAGVSGLIAIAATLPGWPIVVPDNPLPDNTLPARTASTPPSAEGGDNAHRPDDPAAEPVEVIERSPHAIAVERLGQAFLAGMLIRITGTVALFLASSYYMEASPTQIGIWVLGWHLVLLLTEVITLSRQIRVS